MKKTAFHSIHQKLNAKIVEFAGYLMPVQYSSIIAEHKAVRNSVGVFDVSHMGEIFIRGENALRFVQNITVNDASKLFPGRVQYSAMCYPDGGIVDDLLVYKISDGEYMLVVNASNIEKDFNWMVENSTFGVELINSSDDYSLLAVQGPNSKEVLTKVCQSPLEMEYYYFKYDRIADTDVLISRTGYTGELGYEIYFRGGELTAAKIWDAVFDAGKEYNIQPVGLGARDSLRLEMGYCLYGNDIDKAANPLEAGLGWITKLSKDSFIGKEALLKIKEEGLKKKLAGLISNEKIFPRHGYNVMVDENRIGYITSGTVSPVLEKPIALAYLETEHAFPGNKVNISIRGKEFPAEVVTLPFIKK